MSEVGSWPNPKYVMYWFAKRTIAKLQISKGQATDSRHLNRLYICLGIWLVSCLVIWLLGCL